MSKNVMVMSAVSLKPEELQLIKSQLGLSQADQIDVKIDSSLIAGIKVMVNGQTVDLSVKQQLADIALQ